jgi:cytochrome P450
VSFRGPFCFITFQTCFQQLSRSTLAAKPAALCFNDDVSESSRERPPGPKLHPRLQAFAFIRDPLSFLTKSARRYGDVVSLQLGAQRTFLLNHPDYIRDVFLIPAEDMRKGPRLQRAKSLLGEGLVTSEGDLHKKQRRIIQPAFHRQALAKQAAMIAEIGEHYAASCSEGETRDIHLDMRHLTLAIITTLLFGKDMGKEFRDQLTQQLSASMRHLNLLGMRPGSLMRWVKDLPFSQAPDLHQNRAEVDNFIYEVIAQRRRSGVNQGDVLSMLMAATAEDQMSDKQIRDEVITLIHAGHETTANALTWTWYLLGRHPEVETKLHQEINRVLDARVPTFDDLVRLPYAEMVFQESMRLYSPAWLNARVTLKDFSAGRYTLPAGALLMASQYVMHRDPRYFADPDQFMPERWTAEVRHSLPQFAYFPFGGGHRRCIGESLAMMEGVLLLATISARWRLRPRSTRPVAPRAFVTLRPKTKILLKMEQRA